MWRRETVTDIWSSNKNEQNTTKSESLRWTRAVIGSNCRGDITQPHRCPHQPLHPSHTELQPEVYFTVYFLLTCMCNCRDPVLSCPQQSTHPEWRQWWMLALFSQQKIRIVSDSTEKHLFLFYFKKLQNEWIWENRKKLRDVVSDWC